MISLLIPVFNEKEAVEQTVRDAHAVCNDLGEDFEVVVINDGSTDGTDEILDTINLTNFYVINQPHNRGYGSSLKTGIRKCNGDLIATTDADGTYPIADLKKMFAVMKEKDADMVVGARTKKGVKIPLIRRPAKAVVALLANRLTGMKIPDNNSGLRIFKKSMAEKFMHLYPQGFSFTLTITLASMTNDYIVEFVPIDYFKRKGSSSMSAGLNGVKHFVNFLGLIIRIVTYFRPLRFFMMPSIVFMTLGIGIMLYTIVTQSNISDAGMLLTLTGLQIALFGLLADIVVRSRQA